MVPSAVEQTRNGAAGSQRTGMGTVITFRAFGEHAAGAVRAAEAEVAALELTLSRFVESSEISELSRAAGGDGIPLSRTTLDVLARAGEFAETSGGLLDVTLAPVVDVWRTAARLGTDPAPDAVRDALALVDHRDLVLDQEHGTGRLERAGQAVDLGGIGKGYTADRVLEVYRRHGLSSALVNLGGNVAVLGARPDGSPWRIGIRNPRSATGLLGAVLAADASVVTSGDYMRCFTGPDGQRRHHLLDPITGYPAGSGLASVTIVAPTSTEADALATIVFVAGLDRGLSLVRRTPGVEAVLVDVDLRLHVTEGLADRFLPAGAVSITFHPEEWQPCPETCHESSEPGGDP